MTSQEGEEHAEGVPAVEPKVEEESEEERYGSGESSESEEDRPLSPAVRALAETETRRLYEEMERLRLATSSRGLRQSATSGTARSAASATTAAGRGVLRDEMMSALRAGETEESKESPEVKDEVKDEVSMTQKVTGGVGRVSQLYGLPRGPAPASVYDEGEASGYEADETEAEIEEEEQQRTPNGFIARYTGQEERRTDYPTFRWAWNPQYAGASQAPPVKNKGAKKLPAKRASQTTVATKKVSHASAPMKSSGTLGTSAKLNIPKGGQSTTTNVAPPVKKKKMTSGKAAKLLEDDLELSRLVAHKVKALPYFADTATFEKARDFWESFRSHTNNMPDESRLLVFRQKLKGREAERWWDNSSIKTFDALRIRFHNQYLSLTTDQLWDRLQNTKRERGESVEEWGDRVSDLCESLDYPNSQMRYQLFRRGLRNKRMLATLDAGPANDIPEACEWLMFKDMHRPIEEEDQFTDAAPDRGKESPILASVDALAQKFHIFLENQQQWQEKKLQQSRWQVPRSPRNRSPTVNAIASPAGSPRLQSQPSQLRNGRPSRGILMADDTRTQDGVPVCGRCNYRGHGRATCKRQTMECRRCGGMGHIVFECEAPDTRGYQGASAGGAPYRRSSGCYFCHDTSHVVSNCPAIAALRALVPQAGAAPASSQAAPRQ